MSTATAKKKSARRFFPANDPGYIHMKVPSEDALFLGLLSDALREARAKHPRAFADGHHALGILAEEIREIEAEVFRREPRSERVKSEFLDAAAVCIRAMQDLPDDGKRGAR